MAPSARSKPAISRSPPSVRRIPAARKLLPVVDNLTRALDAERSVENRESKEFRHFLHGIELITKQLNDEISVLTNDFVTATSQVKKLQIWMACEGLRVDSLRKDVITEMLTRPDLDERVRAAYTGQVQRYLVHLEALLGNRERAATALSTLVGAVLVARAVGAGELSDEILAAARESVLAMAPTD